MSLAAEMTPAGPREQAGPSRGLIVLLAAITLVRLLAAATIPLTEDEAYYRLWAASPQFGYYDHPPMIAWWIHLGVGLIGDSPLGVRLVPVLSCLLTSLLVFDLAGQLGASRAAAERAAVWTNATFLIGVGGMLAIPDAANVPFWTATLCLLARTTRGPAPGWWLAAGVTAGLACLSKYSALFLAPGVVLWLMATPGGLARLKRPWPWLTVVVAAAIFSLNIAWNAGHHWVAFVKQFGRVAPSHLTLKFMLELILGQALLLNPLVTAFLIRAMRRPTSGADLRLPLATALPFAAYLVLHALHDRVQAHWPVPLYPALALCAAVAADQVAPNGGWAWARRLAAPVGLGLSALTLIHLAAPATDIKGRDPAGPLRGWPGLAKALEARRQAAGGAWVGTLSYGVDAQLENQPALAAPVLQVIERDRYPATDGSWRADLSRPGLMVDLQRRLTAQRLGRCFAQVTPLGPLSRGPSTGPEGRYAVFRVAGPRADVLKSGCPAGT